MHHIIGFVGYKQSGKDTAASLCHEHLVGTGLPIKTYSIASRIKEDVAAQIGQTVEWVNEHKNNPVIRNALQWYGNDYAKSISGEEIWIDKLAKKITELETPHIILIPDVRFKIESSWIKAQRGLLIRVERKGQVNTDTHSSETEQDSISVDHTLTNNGKYLPAFNLECKWICDFAKQYFKL